MVKLSKRLSHLADMARFPVLADVGTDHGYLPIYLLQSGKIQKAFAMDIGEGPLLAAKEHVRACGLDDYITARRSDGVSALEPGEADTILIAGMGGDVMLHILKEGEPVIRAAKELILQPQSKIKEVRQYLFCAGYEIDREDMVFEDGKYYPMLRAVPGAGSGEEICDAAEHETAIRYGRLLLEREDETLRRYLLRMTRRYRGILDSLNGQRESEEILARKKEVWTELSYAERALRRMGGKTAREAKRQGAKKEA